MKKFYTCLLFVVAMITLSGSWAAQSQLSDTDPQSRQRGVLDHVNISDGKVVINDRLFLIRTNTPVTLPSGRSGSLSELRQGAQVDFVSIRLSDDQKPTITHIWIVP